MSTTTSGYLAGGAAVLAGFLLGYVSMGRDMAKQTPIDVPTETTPVIRTQERPNVYFNITGQIGNEDGCVARLDTIEFYISTQTTGFWVECNDILYAFQDAIDPNEVTEL